MKPCKKCGCTRIRCKGKWYAPNGRTLGIGDPFDAKPPCAKCIAWVQEAVI
jgi:hypothetical protein